MYRLNFLSLLALAWLAFAQNDTNSTSISSFPNITSTSPNINWKLVTDQSAPFWLQLVSRNQTLDGAFVIAIHEGAAAESLAVFLPDSGPDPYNLFRLNTTRYVCTFDNGTETPCDIIQANDTKIGVPGYLTWNLPFEDSNDGPTLYVSQVMKLSPRGVSSNINFLPLGFTDMYDSGGQLVAFDENECMNLQDGIVPNSPSNEDPFGDPRPYYRWWICVSWYSWYEWSHLVWVSGRGEPDLPNCVKVDVKRVWA